MKLFRLILILLLGANCSLAAQDTSNYNSFEKILQDLERKYKVTFSYANNQIENLELYNYKPKSTLQDNLNQLLNLTPFQFKKIDKQIIAVILNPSFEYFCVQPMDFQNEFKSFNLDFFFSTYKINAKETNQVTIPVNRNANAEISVNAVGFDKVRLNTKNLKTGKCFELYLFAETIDLDEVIITNYLTKGIDKMKAGQIRFNPMHFGALPGLIEPDVLQSIQTLPGVMSTEESVSYLNIRGGTHDQNLFLWDGIKMYQTSHFFGMITSLNPYITQSTDIIKNASSPEFGDGVSSVINMKSSDQINSKLKAEAGVNMIHADFFIDAPLQENSSLQVTGRQSINQIAETPTYNQFFDKVFQNTSVLPSNTDHTIQNDEFSFYDFSFRWLYQITEKDFLRINGLFTYNQFSLNRQQIQSQQVATRESSLDQQTFALGAFYERKWKPGFTSSIQFYTSNYQLKSINTDLSFNQSLTQENQVEEWGIKLKNKLNFSDQLNFYAGYQLNETGILNFENLNFPIFTRSVREAIITNSLFAGLEFQPSQKTYVNLGARVNHITKFNSILFEPRINFSHRFLENFIVEFQAEKKSQTTSQVIDQQSDFLGVENRRWILAKPGEIPIITSEQASVGFHFKNKDWLVTTDFFYKRILDITSQSQGFQNQFQFELVHGNYEVFGGEFLINKKWNRFSTWLSYTVSENVYYFEDFEPQRFVNNIDIRHVIHYGLNYKYKGLNLASGVYWHSGLPTTSVVISNNNEFNFGSPNQNRLRNFFRIDFSANYRWTINDQVKLYSGISFWNLLGRRNFYNSFYQSRDYTALEETFQQGLNFTPNFSFRLQF